MVELTAASWAARSVAGLVAGEVELMAVWTIEQKGDCLVAETVDCLAAVLVLVSCWAVR